MQEYIIESVSEQNRFIQYDAMGKMCITNKREKATKFCDANKAWKVLMNQMPKKKRDGFKVSLFEQEGKGTSTRIRVDVNLDCSEEAPFDWSKVISSIQESFSEIISYKEKMSSKLSKIEAELCDCEHACEFFKCDASHGYKLYAMIRERRIKRRFYKDELWKANSVLGMSYSDIANGGIEHAFTDETLRSVRRAWLFLRNETVISRKRVL